MDFRWLTAVLVAFVALQVTAAGPAITASSSQASTSTGQNNATTTATTATSKTATTTATPSTTSRSTTTTTTTTTTQASTTSTSPTTTTARTTRGSTTSSTTSATTATTTTSTTSIRAPVPPAATAAEREKQEDSDAALEAKWDTMSIRTFRNMLINLVDERIERFRSKLEESPRGERHIELIELLEEYGLRLRNLTQRVQSLEGDDIVNGSMAAPTAYPQYSLPSSTTSTKTTTTAAPTTTHKNNKNTPADVSGQQQPAILNGQHVIVTLSEESKQFLVDMLANFTRTAVLPGVSQQPELRAPTHSSSSGSSGSSGSTPAPGPTNLNITLRTTADVLKVPVGTHKILLANHPDYYLNSQDVSVRLQMAPGVTHLNLTCPVFQVEKDDNCSYDYLQVLDVKYCGQSPPDISSTASEMEIRFKSDGSNTGQVACKLQAS